MKKIKSNIFSFMLPFSQLTGSSCWEPNQSCNSFVSQFNSGKLFPPCISFLLEVIIKSIDYLVWSHCSVTGYLFQVPAIAAYIFCAIFGFQVLLGIVKVKKLDERERLITGIAWAATWWILLYWFL